MDIIQVWAAVSAGKLSGVVSEVEVGEGMGIPKEGVEEGEVSYGLAILIVVIKLMFSDDRGRGRGGRGGYGGGGGGGGDSRPPVPESSTARMRKMVVKFADEEVSFYHYDYVQQLTYLGFPSDRGSPQTC